MDPHSVSPSEVPSPHRASEVDATARARGAVLSHQSHPFPGHPPRIVPDPVLVMGHASFHPNELAKHPAAESGPYYVHPELEALHQQARAKEEASTKARLERGIDSALAHLSGSLLGADPDHVYVEESVSDCRAALLAALAAEGFPKA